jgi:hypothetical protein
MATGQRKRTHKTSKGQNKNRKNPLSPLNRVLMGKGQYRSMEHIKCGNWKGASVKTPFDPVQAELNKQLYPDLFMDSSERV